MSGSNLIFYRKLPLLPLLRTILLLVIIILLALNINSSLTSSNVLENKLRACTIGFASMLALLAIFSDKRTSIWTRIAGLFASIVFGINFCLSLWKTWPIAASDINFLRLVISLVGIVVILRLLISRENLVPTFPIAILVILAVLGLACFYNMGSPQFFNYKEGRRTYVHTYDLRVYFPLVKYFKELRFDGLYLASIAAYLEGNSAAATQTVDNVVLRDLRTYKLVRAYEVKADILKIKGRFTAERWDNFKQDMRWFWQAMGAGDYLGSLGDHGGSATPAWIMLTYAIFGSANASEKLFLLSGLIDPLLLILLLIAIARTFGGRTALICALIFGATNFPVFGTTWAGSTLRFDWMAALGFGACALKTQRWLLGGATLALAALLRAFPVVGVIFLVVPGFIWIIEKGMINGKLPSIDLVRKKLKPLWLSMAGAAGLTIVMVILSSLLFSFHGSWLPWKDKVAMHSTKLNINHVGLRTLASYDPENVARRVIRNDLLDPWTIWIETHLQTFKKRKLLYETVMAILILLTILACRKKSLNQAAITGLLLIPVIFYPANYYCHYIFLLPLMIYEEEHPWLWGWVGMVLLAVCSLQYFTINRWTDERFAYDSVILLTAYILILLPMVWQAWSIKEIMKT